MSDYQWTLGIAGALVVIGYVAARDPAPGTLVKWGIFSAVFSAVNELLFGRTTLPLVLLATLPMILFAGWAALGPSAQPPASHARRVTGAVVGLLAFVAVVAVVTLLRSITGLGSAIEGFGALRHTLYEWSQAQKSLPSLPVFLQPRIIVFVLVAAVDFLLIYAFAAMIAAVVNRVQPTQRPS